MAVVVRETSHRSYRFRRLARRAGAVIGALLLIAAATTAMLVVIIPALLAVGLSGSGDDEAAMSSEDRAIVGQLGRVWLIAFVITATGWPTGTRLLRGRRCVVLWLRRFRYGDATLAVSKALDYIGRSWRVVTLDDTETESVGVAAGLRISTRLLTGAARVVRRLVPALKVVFKLAAIASIVGIVAVVVWTATEGELPALMDSLPGGRGRPADNTESLLLWIFGGVLVVELGLLVLYLVLLLAAIPLIGLSVIFGAVRSGVSRAETNKNRLVRSRDDIDDIAASIAASGGQMLAPRLTLLTVESSVWQETVTELARGSTAVLIDVSQATDNVLWEVEEMTRVMGTRTVFVAHQERLGPLTGSVAVDDGFDRLRQLLDGREVLAYTTSFMGRLRFERALFGELEGTLPPTPLTGHRIIRSLFVLVGIVGFVLAVRAALDFVVNQL